MIVSIQQVLLIGILVSPGCIMLGIAKRHSETLWMAGPCGIVLLALCSFFLLCPTT